MTQTGTRPYATVQVQCSLAPCERLGKAHELEERIGENVEKLLEDAVQ